MARPERHDADYFPFYVKDGKTLFILESKYGLQGIGFFTNLMRFLCKQPDHHISIREESDRLYFFAQIRCQEDIGMDMLNLMVKTGKIDAKLWNEQKVIVSLDLLESLKDAYKNRNNPIIGIDEIRVTYQHNPITSPDNPITYPDKPQRKGKETKGKEIVTIELPDWISKDTWNDFSSMRKDKKEPLTNISAKRIISKLEKLRKVGQDPNEILDESIANGWKGVFPLKGGNDGNRSGNYRGSGAPYPQTGRGQDDRSRGLGIPKEYKPEHLQPISEEDRERNLERVKSIIDG